MRKPRVRYDNRPLREAFSAVGVCCYEVAEELGVHESTLGRWLRWRLPEDVEKKVLQAVCQVAARRGADVNLAKQAFTFVSGLDASREKRKEGIVTGSKNLSH